MPQPLRILYLSPPLDASGGVGRVAEMHVSALRTPDTHITYRDSRGRGSVAMSFLIASRIAWHVLRHRRYYDLAHINTSIRASTARKSMIGLAARMAGLPYVIHLHGSGYDDYFARQPPSIQRWVQRYFAGAAKVIVLGKHWQEFAHATLALDKEKVVRIANAAPGPTSPPPRAVDHELRVVFLGNLGKRKGCHLLLEALAQLAATGRTIPTVIAGDGDDSDLRAFARSHRLDVTFHGWVDSEQVREILSRSDVLVLPSESENQPLVVVEALAHGVVPVVTDVGAVVDLVEDGQSGIVLPARTSTAIAHALTALTAPGVLPRMSRTARNRWEAELTVEQHCRAVRNVWEQARSDPPAIK